MNSKEVIRQIVRKVLFEGEYGKGMFHNFARFNDPEFGGKISNKNDDKFEKSTNKDVWSNNEVFEKKENLSQNIDNYKKELISLVDDNKINKNSYNKFIEESFKNFKKIFDLAFEYYKINGTNSQDLIQKLNNWSETLRIFLNKNAKELKNKDIKKKLGLY